MKLLFNSDNLQLTPENIKDIFLKLSEKYSLVTINIATFCELLKINIDDQQKYFTPVTQREILITGYYGTFNGMKIFVRKIVEPGYLTVEEKENNVNQ